MSTTQSSQFSGPRSPKAGRYDPPTIEARWQAYWENHQTFRIPNPGDPGADTTKPKFYILDMFPYPSGAGLHVGHPVGYCATDIIARFKRMQGYNVLHPMGFDSFGLPAEQYAVETNVHPVVTTKANIDMYRRQLKKFGFSYDWSRELATSDPNYYQWTQWMFVRMFESWYDRECSWVDGQGKACIGKARPISELIDELESGRWGVDEQFNIERQADNPHRKGWRDLNEADRRRVLDRQRLAYMDEVPVNWCPALGTVLANEEVDNEGRSERGRHPVYRRPLRQWMLRITEYAERLLEDLAGLDWPEPIKLMQRNWIGKSTGAEVVFPLADHWSIQDGAWKCSDSSVDAFNSSYERFEHAIHIYTTRPDTLFGATYMVLAPEHPLVEKITTDEQRQQVRAYVESAARRSELERTAETKDKTGVFTGVYAINPVNGWRIPIWVADYVLMGYGTGAIMAVPCSDTRDFEFAVKFGLPIVVVVKPTAEWIEERIEALTGQIEPDAQTGFTQSLKAFPEMADVIKEKQSASTGLGDRTDRMLKDRVGIDLLIEHYVRRPQTWGAAFIELGIAVNSPGAVGTVRKGRAVEKGGEGGAVGEDGTSKEPSVPGGVCRLDGLTTEDAKARIIEWLEKTGVGRGASNYKLRDWLFSRQRYWGEPFPVLHGEDGETLVLGDDELPLELPEMKDFRPTASDETSQSLPEPPLGRAKEWATVTCDGKTYRRDLNTMPQWAGSCWYYLRFIDSHNPQKLCDPEAENYWMPIDLYVGGAEHAVLHLLYARFWHKVLFDLGYVSTREPFKKLFNQGMIQGFAFKNQRGMTISPEQVEERDSDQFIDKTSGESVMRVIAKMSKSLKNVVNPDEIIAEYGADTFRLYEMYMGPLDASKPWNTRDVPGLYKLCQRIWRLVVDEQTGESVSALTDDPPDNKNLKVLHKTIMRVTEDLQLLKLNTAIAALFDFVNIMTPKTRRSRAVIEPFILILSPFAPHLAEELWSRLGHERTLAYEPWPVFDETLTRDDQVEIGVQVNGKLKARISVPADADDAFIEQAARAEAPIIKALEGKTVRKVIVVKGRLVSFVVG